MKRDKPFLKCGQLLGKTEAACFFLLKALSCKDISAKDKKICNTKIFLAFLLKYFWKYGTVVL